MYLRIILNKQIAIKTVKYFNRLRIAKFNGLQNLETFLIKGHSVPFQLKIGYRSSKNIMSTIILFQLIQFVMEQEQQILQKGNQQTIQITLSDIASPTKPEPTQTASYPSAPEAGGHVHSQKCQHGHQHGANNHDHGHHHSHGHHGHAHANCIVLLLVVVLIMSSFSMQHFYFNTVYENFTSILVSRTMKFLAFMAVWSFIQTVRGDNGIENIRSKLEEIRQSYADRLKECYYCDLLQIARVSHCMYCSKCIYKESHHCFWAQNCVGYSNQRSFFLFIFYSLCGCIVNLYSNYLYTYKHYQNPELFASHGILFYLMWIGQTIALITIAPILVGVFISQVLFITNNTTGTEISKLPTLKLPFIEFRKKYLDNINIYDRGELQNVVEVFGNNILTFWMPFNRRIKNDLLPQKTHPQPTKFHILHHYPELRKAEEERAEKMANFVSQVKQIYSGMEVTINGKNVTL